LEIAMSKFPQAEFEVNWRPFELNPDAPKTGTNKLKMYNEKFGEERVKMMMPRMTEAFAKVGIKYSIGGDTGNTFDSHRLIYYAGTKGKQDAVVEELFLNYFSQEKFIGDRAVLLAAAEKSGLDKEEAAKVLDEPSMFKKQVEEEKRLFGRQFGVSGVPYFIINKEEGVSGAQPPETFLEIFTQHLKA
jgi:predicted DsbA family dithiol-disulfide isomerase